MRNLIDREVNSVTGGWLIPAAQGVALGISTFAGLSHLDTAYNKYNGWGHSLGEWAFNSTHSDADILGQMEYTASDFS